MGCRTVVRGILIRRCSSSTEPRSAVAIRQIAMRSFPFFLQPLVNLLIPWTWKLESCKRAATKILQDELERRARAEDEDPAYVKPCDLLQAVTDMAEKERCRDDTKRIANQTLLLLAVAGHSTAGSASQTLLNLLARPEYAELLRDEARTMLRDEENCFTRSGIARLWKMDSFLRE